MTPMKCIKEVLSPPKLTKQQKKILEQAIAIQENPCDPESLGYYNKFFVTASLPHKEPSKEKPVWSRVNGNYTLKIQQHWDDKKEEWLGFPYGIIPRLVIMFIDQEIIRTGQKRIYLGHLSEFMRSVGLDPTHGGKRGDIRRFKEQLLRLFYARISFDYDEKIENDYFHSFLNMHIVKGGVFWWTGKRNIDNFNLSKSWIEVTDDYFKSVRKTPLPFDTRVIKAVRKSPLAIDLYLWSSAKNFQMVAKGKKSEFIPWGTLHKQFGSDYSAMDDFAKKVKLAFTKIKPGYNALKITYQRSSRGRKGGMIIHATQSSILPKLGEEKQKKISPPTEKEIEVPKDPQYWKTNPALKAVTEESVPKLSENAIRECIRMAPQYDPYKLVEDWLYYWAKNGYDTIKYPDKAFLAFTIKSLSLSH